MALASGGKRKESITLNTPHCRVPNSAFFLRGWKVHWRMRQATWRFILELACTTCYIVTPYELVSSLASSFRGRFKIDQKMFRIALLAVYSPLRSSAQLPSPASLSLPFSCRLHTLTLLSPLSVADHQPPNALVHQRRPSSSGSISGSSASRRAAATSRSSTTTTTTIITTTGSKRGATTSISSSSGRSSSGGGTAIRTARMRGAMRTHSPGSSTSRGHGSAVRGNNSAASSGLAVRGGRLLVNALPVGSAAVPQRYLPQCRPCSQQQAAVLRNGTTSLVLSRGWRAVPKVSSTKLLAARGDQEPIPAAIGDQEPIPAASVDRVVRERDMESSD